MRHLGIGGNGSCVNNISQGRVEYRVRRGESPGQSSEVCLANQRRMNLQKMLRKTSGEAG